MMLRVLAAIASKLFLRTPTWRHSCGRGLPVIPPRHGRPAVVAHPRGSRVLRHRAAQHGAFVLAGSPVGCAVQGLVNHTLSLVTVDGGVEGHVLLWQHPASPTSNTACLKRYSHQHDDKFDDWFW